jgi:hypothetical protein
MIDVLLFKRALSRVIAEKSNDSGIGTLTEKTVHKTLKLYYEPDESKHEVSYLGKIADIINDNGITEIQTGSFSKIKIKLKKFLPVSPVTLVYPIICEKQLRWLDRETGIITHARNNGRIKTVFDAGRELYTIREFLTHSNLTVKLVFLKCEEYRALDGYDATRKKGATVLDCIPVQIIDEILLSTAEDYRIFIPSSLGEEFTVKDFNRAVKSRSVYTYYSIRLAEYFGFVTHTHNLGRAFVYKRR